jgi:Tol biopolymer transport system component
VSKDGKTIVAAFNGSASPWGTFDTTSGNSIFVSGSDPSNGPAGSGFQAISPDGKLVLYGQERQLAYLSLNPYDSATEVAELNPGTGNPCQPAWSTDGNHVAFAVRADGNWLDYTQSALWTADIDPAASPPAFTNIKQIIAGTATRPTTTYPSYSPDSKWISFERSTQVRSRGAQAEMWLTSFDGATQVSLDAANTGTGLFTQTDANYEGTFMPVAVGGYFWLVFVSERVYGNILTDTNEGTTSAPGRHKQLWVTAIDAQPSGATDPSHPAFWLPGQNTADQNMRGEWALDPCKQQGQSCQAGYQCCAGYCRADDAGTPVCTTPQGGCSSTGEACKTAADCCAANAACIGGFCNVLPH